MKNNSIEYRLPYAGTDQMSFIYYAHHLVYFERLRNELLRQTGISYREWEEKGFRLPVVEAHCQYPAPAFSDHFLRIDRIRIWIEYVVKRGQELLTRGYTVQACRGRQGRPIRVPAEINEHSAVFPLWG